MEQNFIFMLLWGSITLQDVNFMSNVFWQKCYTITVNILIH